MVRLAMFLIAITTAAHASGGQLHDFEKTVRTENAALRQLIRDARAASPTIRALIERLERSDIIVYVAWQHYMRVSLDGQLNFVTKAGGRRYLRIQVSSRLSPRRLAAILAHELRHAVEIAEACDVVDAATLADAYARLGQRAAPHRDGTVAFETRAAVDAATRVWREFDSSSSADD